MAKNRDKSGHLTRKLTKQGQNFTNFLHKVDCPDFLSDGIESMQINAALKRQQRRTKKICLIALKAPIMSEGATKIDLP